MRDAAVEQVPVRDREEKRREERLDARIRDAHEQVGQRDGRKPDERQWQPQRERGVPQQRDAGRRQVRIEGRLSERRMRIDADPAAVQYPHSVRAGLRFVRMHAVRNVAEPD